MPVPVVKKLIVQTRTDLTLVHVDRGIQAMEESVKVF